MGVTSVENGPLRQMSIEIFLRFSLHSPVDFQLYSELAVKRRQTGQQRFLHLARDGQEKRLQASYFVYSTSVIFNSFTSNWADNTQARLTWSVYWLPLLLNKIAKPANVLFIIGVAHLGWRPFTLLKFAVTCRVSALSQSVSASTARHRRHLYLQNNCCHAMLTHFYFASVNGVSH